MPSIASAISQSSCLIHNSWIKLVGAAYVDGKLAAQADAAARNIAPNSIAVWAPRTTLWLASGIVLGAAYYCFRTLSWTRIGRTEREAVRGEPR